MLRIKDYMQKFEESSDELRELMSDTDINADMIIESLTPTERKVVEMLGGEVMLRGIINGAVSINERGELRNDELHKSGCDCEGSRGC